MSEHAKRTFVQGRIGAANAAEFFGVLREIQASVDVVRLLAARPGTETAALLPKTLDGLYGMIYGLLAASVDEQTLARALEIVEQLPRHQGRARLPVREVADPGDGASDAEGARRAGSRPRSSTAHPTGAMPSSGTRKTAAMPEYARAAAIIAARARSSAWWSSRLPPAASRSG